MYSRQRTWGTQLWCLCVVTMTNYPRTLELMEEVAKRVEKDGIQAWFDLDAKELLGDVDDYRKVTDTLDVWLTQV